MQLNTRLMSTRSTMLRALCFLCLICLNVWSTHQSKANDRGSTSMAPKGPPVQTIIDNIEAKFQKQKTMRTDRKAAELPPLSKDTPDRMEKEIEEYLQRKIFFLNRTSELYKQALFNISKFQKRRDDVNASVDMLANKSGRRQHAHTKYGTNVNQQKRKALDLIMQSIYSTQERMRSMENITNKYVNDVRYRAAFVFAKLDQLSDDIHGLHTIAQKSKGNFKRLVVHYNHILRRNVDITYVVEYVINMHELVVAAKGQPVVFNYVPYESVDGMIVNN